MKKNKASQRSSPDKVDDSPVNIDSWESSFALFAGIFCGLAPLKFGNPVIFESMIATPRTALEFIYSSWPVYWGYILLAILAVWGWKSFGIRKGSFHWLLLLPCVWLLWQFVSASGTIDMGLTEAALKHQTAIVTTFFLGFFSLSRIKNLTPFWIGTSVGLILVFWSGFKQHYGGLEELRSIPEEELLQLLGTDELPPLLEIKLNSGRIFATLVYPNALAGVIILVLPCVVVPVWELLPKWGSLLKKILVGLLIYMGAACLLWSGSKAGWLIVMSMLLFAILHFKIKRSAKIALVIGCCVLGLTAFAFKYADYFQQGATSAVARLDYWRAGIETFIDNPVTGSGPGTFGPSYRLRKAPESEMAQLAHNDYLQQASDSGTVGFVCYFVFVWGSLFHLYKKLRNSSRLMLKMVWLGIFGWALQGFVEFGLYVPALSWTTFLLLGWLWGEAFDLTENCPRSSVPESQKRA